VVSVQVSTDTRSLRSHGYVEEALRAIAVPRMPLGELRYRLRCIDKLGYLFRGDESVLDAGCGDGGVAALLRERVRNVVAVDVEPDETWQDRPGLAFLQADAERLPFGRATFDVVHSKDSLHHMESPERALAEYRRVIKPGGTALIVEANRNNPLFYPHMTAALGHQHFTRARFQALVRSAFSQVRFGAFEAHYVPGLNRFRFQHSIEEVLGRITPFRPLLAYNFAVAVVPSKLRLT
jgi:ubiquinone/menaquinone biosynthesis C-methylase UbiE